MKTIYVPVSDPYEVRIGPGLLPTLGRTVRSLCPKASRYVLVTDTGAGPHWAGKAADSLISAGLAGDTYTLPEGEASKTAANLVEVLNFAASRHLTRSDVFIALGGGMVGDLTGLAAAPYMRGVDYIQIPTTLLAAVDSSVGGKTAVDLPAGKNLMGAFWQPKHVLCDTDTLSTLTDEEFTSGCAEVIKTMVLFNADLFDRLYREGKAFDLEAVIARCVDYKQDVVSEDEHDTGRRAFLNLGHTMGHALEAESGFALSHGQAVAIGMATVCRAAAKAGLCPDDVPRRVEAILEKFGLPTRTDIPFSAIVERIRSDKKRSGDTINIIVPVRIGACVIRPMGIDEAREFIKAGF